MRTVTILLSCLACAGNARRMQPTEKRTEGGSSTEVAASETSHSLPQVGAKNSVPHPLKDLAMMLMAPAPDAAFMASGVKGGFVRPAVSSSKSPLVMQAGEESVQSASAETPAAAETEAPKEVKPSFNVKDMAGVTAPLGFFDPAGFSNGASEGKIRFYREVELKHGRVAMLAALGFLVGEQFHPLFGGDIDVPSYIAFQATPLQKFWYFVVFWMYILEIFPVFGTFVRPDKALWEVRSDHYPGDLDWDPLGLKPRKPEDLKTMQTKELNNGRLAMFGIAGMVAQELVSGQKLF